jgi:hypothetical protein
MYADEDKMEGAHSGPVHTFTEAADVWVPRICLSAWCPSIVTTLVMVRQLRGLTVGLTDAADVIVSDLGGGGQFSKKRVGLRRD